MADEYTDVNKYAHEGGDTSPDTRKQIAARNKVADKAAAALVKAREAREKAELEYADAVAAAESEYRDSIEDPAVVSSGKK